MKREVRIRDSLSTMRDDEVDLALLRGEREPELTLFG
jgi:hypothetical protein